MEKHHLRAEFGFREAFKLGLGLGLGFFVAMIIVILIASVLGLSILGSAINGFGF